MSQFIQLHLLTSYPPANLNRDDQGRPKTAKMGGADRLRVSSQSLKRTWRTSDLFQSAVAGHIGERTKLFGVEVFKYLIAKDQSFKDALAWSTQIAAQFGKPETFSDLKKKSDADKAKILNKLKAQWLAWDDEGLGIAEYSLEQLNSLLAVQISQLAFISPEEREAAFLLADRLVAGEVSELKNDLELLRDTTSAVDVALFGRMLADSPSKNIEAACQVAHAISVHPVVIEDDYFTAVDDLNDRSVDAGAAHIGETAFAAGLFYSYICINKSQLIDNLGGGAEGKKLADRAVSALAEAAIKVAPQGKQNSFASRAYASYVLAEVGEQQPRSLAASFLKAITQRDTEDFAVAAIAALKAQYQAFDQVYGDCADHRYEINVPERTGTLKNLLASISE
ncbi:type I-E CRISPR-associated protein Cas7/Cse4/CasC [Motiliproteus sp. MSK22-1]|uniref:type I-E CRISPR-associated protein Cas7/Cse4/CasC n=1 Tax=Motiliproteus sp. MSK22-1 TaxID=1897630 RepID=UPI000977423B|nr:type I-E CRISPR-associated protein Cas7/Cse4/CasC [Motiliproteus sp. MSK22-1]OMH30526.1 type I-E CRISPR-associated protein Cas7/Cse4/CasC [Motiliproteus sp. MSK22-1]